MPELFDNLDVESSIREERHHSLVILGNDQQLHIGVDGSPHARMDDIDAFLVKFGFHWSAVAGESRFDLCPEQGTSRGMLAEPQHPYGERTFHGAPHPRGLQHRLCLWDRDGVSKL
jgi:hypothetical protein